MINNIKNLFIKYNNKNSKKNIIENFISIIEKETGLTLNESLIKIDLNNKTIFLNKNNSGLKFILESKIDKKKKENIEKELKYKIFY